MDKDQAEGRRQQVKVRRESVETVNTDYASFSEEDAAEAGF